MNDVAALAGVGLKTVSRVVNGQPNVTPALVERVSKAIAQLGYRPNLTASSLRRSDGRTATVGIMLENVANPFSAAVHRAVEDVARERGVTVLAGSLDEDPIRERQLAGALLARQVDGLIIVPASHDHSYLLEERRSGTPMVFIDRPAALLDADAVLVPNREGAAEGVRHLIEHGHRRIAFLGDLSAITTAQERHAGFLDALHASGLQVAPELVRRDLHDAGMAEAATLEVLSLTEPPTAIFSAQNLLTVGALRALRTLHAQRRVALVGFDDLPMADLLDPGLTVVAQDPSAIGSLAASILFRRMDGDSSPSHAHIVPTELISRGSGEIGPGAVRVMDSPSESP